MVEFVVDVVVVVDVFGLLTLVLLFNLFGLRVALKLSLFLSTPLV